MVANEDKELAWASVGGMVQAPNLNHHGPGGTDGAPTILDVRAPPGAQH